MRLCVFSHERRVHADPKLERSAGLMSQVSWDRKGWVGTNAGVKLVSLCCCVWSWSRCGWVSRCRTSLFCFCVIVLACVWGVCCQRMLPSWRWLAKQSAVAERLCHHCSSDLRTGCVFWLLLCLDVCGWSDFSVFDIMEPQGILTAETIRGENPGRFFSFNSLFMCQVPHLCLIYMT